MTEIGASQGTYRASAGHAGATDAAGPGFDIHWGAVTDIGHRRSHNEDSYIAAPPIFAVADGMGGHSAGDVASDAVVSRLSELEGEVVEPSDVAQALGRATVDLTSAIDEAGLGVGTTVTGAALTMSEDVLAWAVFNIGDSRVYLFENAALEQVTRDHSVVQELVRAGQLDARDAENHPEANVITRAVGFGGSPILDVWLVPVRPDTRLLVCSDGLTRELDDAHLRGVLAEGLGALETAEILRDNALTAGGRDNVTAVVVDIVAAPA